MKKNDAEAKNRVKQVRHVVLGKDAFRMIEQPHVGKMKEIIFWFLQCHASATNPYSLVRRWHIFHCSTPIYSIGSRRGARRKGKIARACFAHFDRR